MPNPNLKSSWDPSDILAWGQAEANSWLSSAHNEDAPVALWLTGAHRSSTALQLTRDASQLLRDVPRFRHKNDGKAGVGPSCDHAASPNEARDLRTDLEGKRNLDLHSGKQDLWIIQQGTIAAEVQDPTSFDGTIVLKDPSLNCTASLCPGITTAIRS